MEVRNVSWSRVGKSRAMLTPYSVSSVIALHQFYRQNLSTLLTSKVPQFVDVQRSLIE